MMNITVLDGFALNPGDLSWKTLEKLGTVTVYDRTGTDKSLIRQRALNSDIILTNKTPLTADIIRTLPNLKYIGILATGYNVVDIKAAKEKGIPVTNIPTYGTDSVAQFAFAHILRFCHHIKEHSDTVHAGDWSKSKDFCYWNFPLIELAGKTIGIIGFGRIGRRVGEIANAFGMKVIANDLYHGNQPDWEGFRWAEVDELLRESDFVSLNCALTAENEGLINAKKLALMKKSAFLVNVSRGPLVNNGDLAKALKEGVIAGAGVDVVDTEPPSPDNPLFGTENISITPHIAWATKEARSRLLDTAVKNVSAFITGDLQNVVNGVKI